MTLRGPRFTIGAAMLVIASFATASFGFTMWRRSTYYYAKGLEHEIRAAEYAVVEIQSTQERLWPVTDAGAKNPPWRYLCHIHEMNLASKYYYASRHPWLSVEADPPEPVFVAPDPVFTAPDSGVVRPKRQRRTGTP